MTAGRLRHVLVYQVPSVEADQLGQPRLTWSDHSTHRAEVRAPRAAETTVALQTQATVAKVCESRHPGFHFLPSNRLIDRTDPANTLTYEILSSLDPDGRGRRLTTMVMMREGADG